MDLSYTGSYPSMVSCYFAGCVKNEWIIDFGASDHMTGSFDALIDHVESKNNPHINLPNWRSVKYITTGNVKLKNEIELKNVLYVPAFKHNLLSVNKLALDTCYNVSFHFGFRIIHDDIVKKVKGVGRARNGLIILFDE